jgi:hypothetical protein
VARASGWGEGNDVEGVAHLAGVDAVNDRDVEGAGAHLVDQQIGGRGLDHHVGADAFEDPGSGPAEESLGEGAQGALLGMGHPEAEAGLGEVGQVAELAGIAATGEQDDARAGDHVGFAEEGLHFAHEGDVAGEIGIGPLAGLHLRHEDAAAVVDPRDVGALAFLEATEGLLDGHAVDPAAVEHDFGFLGPRVAVDGSKPRLPEGRLSAVAGGEVAGEVKGGAGLLGTGENAGVDFGGESGELGEFDGQQVGVLAGGGVPHESGVGGAEFHVVGDLADGGFEDPGAGGDGVPAAELAEAVADAASDRRGLGIGEGERDLGAEEVVEGADRLGVGARDDGDGSEVGEGDDLGDQAIGAGEVGVGGVGGEEEVAAAGDLEVGEEGAGATVLDFDGDAVALAVFAGDGFDGGLEAGGAIDEQGARAGRMGGGGEVSGTGEEEADEENSGKQGSEQELDLDSVHESRRPISSTASATAPRRDRMSDSNRRPMEPMRNVSAWLIFPG